MRRGWLLNLVLLAAVAALGWYAWRTPAGSEAAGIPGAARPSAVRQITLQRPGRPLLQLTRSGEHWMLTAPLRARADEFQVLRMLTVLDARPSARLPAGDLSRFDLVSPAAVLTVDDAEYAFGAINTVTREQYVMRDGVVYAVELRHGAGLPADAAALIRRVLLAENEQPVAIVLPAFSVRQTEGRWTVAPRSTDAGQEDLQRYVDGWRHATAARVEAYDGRQPLEDIRLELRNGSTVELGILEREPQLLLWRRDAGLQYRFVAGAAQILLRHPAASANEARKRAN